MEELENKGQEHGFAGKGNNVDNLRQEIFSETVRAGKRTYFFDVKSTRAGEYYLTITESKRRFNNESGKFFYEKHKLFLYKEDFEKFSDGLKTTVDFIQASNTGQKPVTEERVVKDPLVDVDFEDLGKDTSDAMGTDDFAEEAKD